MVKRKLSPEVLKKLKAKAKRSTSLYQKRRKLLAARVAKMHVEIDKMKARYDSGVQIVQNTLKGISTGNPDRKAIGTAERFVKQYLEDLKQIQAQKRKIERTVERINKMAGNIEKLKIPQPQLEPLLEEVAGPTKRLKAFFTELEKWKKKNIL